MSMTNTSTPIMHPTDDRKSEAAIIKVAADSRSTAVAGAIAGVIREYGHADVQAIGAGAVYQAVKALAIAKSYLSEETDIVSVPVFTDVIINGQERTAIRFRVDTKPL